MSGMSGDLGSEAVARRWLSYLSTIFAENRYLLFRIMLKGGGGP
jgi:hypothetical protein